MDKIFQYDNPVWNFLGKIADLVYLTLLWIIFSLPIFTMGAATTAIYKCAQNLLEDEGQLTRVFIMSFRENFKKSTILWLLVLLIGTILSADIYFFSQIDTDWSKIMALSALIFMFLLIMMAIYMFNMLARFENTFKQLFAIAFVLSLKALPWTVFMVVVLLASLAIVFLKYWFVGLIAVGLVAYIHTWILDFVYKKYGLLG
ncbi:MAG: DUF624 domain-containing protein [Clostridiaceae bacterium]